MNENHRLEYKQQLTPELEKEVVAFLNSHEGGIIYIGISKKGEAVGIQEADQTQLLLKDRLKNNILPSCIGLFDIISENADGKSILKIMVAGGYEKPYYIRKYGLSEKGAFIRVGSSSEPMPARMIETLFAKRTRQSIGRITSPKKDLKFEQLQIYFQNSGLTLNEYFAQNLELLNDDGHFNYVAYLLSDQNNISIKVARYGGTDRVELTESNEYGYESLIKAAKQVLDRLNLENRTLTKITEKERKEKRLWNAIALREIIINAFVHNDYTREVAPKFEIFSDRLEITSYGSLPEGLTPDEFFKGVSVLRNKELMRIFKDLDLVEQLGSGIPRVLPFYSKNCFLFSENFLRVVLPSAETVYPSTEQNTEQDTEQDTEQILQLIRILDNTLSTNEIVTLLGLKHRPTVIYNYIRPAIHRNLIEMTLPDKPNSRNQKYRLTAKGKALRQRLTAPS